MRERKIALANNLTEIDYCNPLIKKNSKNKIPISSLINQNVEIDVVKGKKTLEELARDPGRDRENFGNTSPKEKKKTQQIPPAVTSGSPESDWRRGGGGVAVRW